MIFIKDTYVLSIILDNRAYARCMYILPDPLILILLLKISIEDDANPALNMREVEILRPKLFLSLSLWSHHDSNAEENQSSWLWQEENFGGKSNGVHGLPYHASIIIIKKWTN